MIAVVDYGMGNLHSVRKAFEKTGYPAEITDRPEAVLTARGLVLPGVGAFGKAMENLRARELAEPILAYLRSGRPFLGICLGLQLLFSESEEFGAGRGLGFFEGKVVRFPGSDSSAGKGGQALKVPHMGWNEVLIEKPAALLNGIGAGTHFYFVHSFYPVPADPGLAATTTDYGLRFVSSVSRGRVFACQFHPEKSQTAGLKILENFGRLVSA
jgi:imidazole glycerol-phosphate synthase subunit HisH